MNRNYDAIVIGAGQAGPSLTARFAGAGKSVAIVERNLFGGTCVNAGCTPTKTLIASARIAYDARRAQCYGIELPTDSVAVNMRAVQARKKRIVDAAKSGLENWIRGMPNCTVYKGHARFESARSVSVDGQVLTSEQIFINVGGRAIVPPENARQSPGKKKLSYLEVREYDGIEQRVAEAELVLQAKREQLEDPEIVSDGPRLVAANAEMEAAQEKVDLLYSRWAELEKKKT